MNVYHDEKVILCFDVVHDCSAGDDEYTAESPLYRIISDFSTKNILDLFVK